MGSGQDPSGQQDHPPEQAEDALDGDPDQPKRQEDQPDQRIQDEGQQGQRPAQDEENEPEQELRQGTPPSKALSIDTYAGPGGFPPDQKKSAAIVKTASTAKAGHTWRASGRPPMMKVTPPLKIRFDRVARR